MNARLTEELGFAPGPARPLRSGLGTLLTGGTVAALAHVVSYLSRGLYGVA